MKLISFQTKTGEDGFGVLADEGVIDLTNRPAKTLREWLELTAKGSLDASSADGPLLPLDAFRFAPLIPNPDKIVCAGYNYKSHNEEVGKDLPPNPAVFLRATNTLAAHEQALPHPVISDHFDYEGELAVIIGRQGRHVAESDAMSLIAGYTCFLDGSVRDYQKHSPTAGKNFPSTGPIGPSLVTTNDIPDPTKLTLTTRLNGEVVQHSTTDLLIYSIPKIVSYVSAFTQLEPGDIIATGTPEGVGSRRTPPLWMKKGDTIEVEINEIGVLRNTIE
ncbi:MAG: fumarylacetoacetate hydrolase family protein [Pseudomonadota bacterium]